jgi:hypothetical protein
MEIPPPEVSFNDPSSLDPQTDGEKCRPIDGDSMHFSFEPPTREFVTVTNCFFNH